jgi:hypothetical protein
MDTHVLAYLAGIVDGEGYIGIKRTAKPNGSISPRYCERIQVRMVNEEAIRLLTDTLGGNYYAESMTQRRGRPLFCWQASDAQAAGILRALLPYLRIKKGNAVAALALRESKADPRARRRGSPAKRVMEPAVLEHRQELYERCKALNAR